MVTYYIQESLWGMAILKIDQNETKSWIPQDEANSDYRQYLEWVAEGNKAEIVEPSE